MCGRFTLTADPSDLQDAFFWVNFGNANITPRYNIAPTQGIAVVTNDGKNDLDFFTWGLVPFWAEDPSIGNRMINARSETLADKPSFRNAFKRRRCLILADGFYEWQKIPKSKTKLPIYIQMKERTPFAFAVLWENWHNSDGSQILSTTIITTKPNHTFFITCAPYLSSLFHRNSSRSAKATVPYKPWASRTRVTIPTKTRGVS